MPRQLHVFDPPERFVAGTVGQPGERTFFLQATGGGRVVSVALEKAQVAVLAEQLDRLLDEVRRQLGPDGPVPAEAPESLDDNAPLDLPIDEEFRVGTLALAWDGEDGRVVVEARAAGEEGPGQAEPLEDGGEGPDTLRVRVTPVVARAFVRRALRLVAAGRPSCPLCGLPMDPDGHVCPRQNGHHP